jgi:chromosomal replication initiator protein
MPDSTWLLLREELRSDLSDEEIRTWFNPLRVESEETDRLVLQAPNNRFLHALEQSYRPVVDRAIAGLKGKGYEVLFSVAGIDSCRADATATAAGDRHFDRRYRFDSFVVGSSNQFACAAARAVADAPGQSYNPLFLYGGVGLGKTHLLHSVGQEIQARHPRLQILYLSAEQFVNELINSIRFDRMTAFRERYRTIDVLLIDDVQFLANKERTQEEFFHTFNTLYGAQRQIILSSDASPKDIPTLEERLRSRFAWGLIADIQAPDLETKVAILKRKAETEGRELPDPVALFIARRVKSNIRELEGLLNRVLAFCSLTGRKLDLAIAQETLRDILPDADRRINPNDIVKLVARHYGLRLTEIKSRNNSKQIAFPRQVAMYLCKQLTDLSYPEIGRLFNDKHHSTVMYSVEKIDKLRAQERDLDRVLERFAQQLH